MLIFDEQMIDSVLNNPTGYTKKYPNEKIIYKMLQALFERQTHDEQASRETWHDNGIGFSAFDAPGLSKAARDSKPYGGLLPSQCVYVARKLKRYKRQLIEIANEKQPVQVDTKLKKKKDAVPAEQSEFGFNTEMRSKEAL